MEADIGDIRRLDLDSILAASRAGTGLSEIGEPDILHGLRKLIEAYVNEAHFTPMGIEAQRGTLIRIVSNRMRVEDMFRRHPEILQEEIIGPIVITGLARSGTTKLHRMIGASPDLQTFPLWRILHPVPLGPTPPGDKDIRISMAEQMSAAMQQHPDFYAGHPMNPFDPDEEEWLLDMVMLGYVNCHQARTPSFEKWMDQQEFSAWHPYLKKLMQLLQWQDGSPKKPWLIKAPSHLRHMKLLFKTFPNAVIAHCHRNPVTTSISLASLNEAIRRMFSDYQDPPETGRFTYQHWAKQMQGYMEARPSLERDHPFVDIAYAELTSAVMPAIERIHAAAGFELTNEARKAMLDWERANPQGKHGQRSYTIEHFGLTESEVRAAFADYLQRFGNLT